MARPASGYRLKDGTQAIGTTTIIGRFKESGGLLQWAWKRGKEFPDEPLYQARDEAGDVGTYIHALIEANIDDADAPDPPNGFTDKQIKQARHGFSAFAEWTIHTRLKIVRKEKPLVCEHHRYGGTPDAWAEVNGPLAMVDWKSSKGLYYDYVIQLAAYVHLHEDHFPSEKITGIHIIRFSKVGCDFTHRFFRADHPALEIAWRQFQIMREAYDLDKELKRIAA